MPRVEESAATAEPVPSAPEDEVERATSTARLPPLVSGVRRRLMAGLLLCGLTTAALAGVGAWATHRALSAGSPWLVLAVVGAALAVGAVRAGERVLAERLGQDYIHRIRIALVDSALRGSTRTSAGVLIARTTNDLTAVRNWVALGIAPLLVAIPLLLGVVAVLTVIHPSMGLGMVSVLLAMTAVLGGRSEALFDRARTVRRRRGQLASATADTVGALSSIRAGGGESRERNQIDRLGSRVVDAAVRRSRVTGLMRGTAAAAASLATAMVVVLGVLGTVGASQVTAAMLVVGVAAAPLADLGRVVEYRQNFKAARRVLLPALEGTPGSERPSRRDGAGPPDVGAADGAVATMAEAGTEDRADHDDDGEHGEAGRPAPPVEIRPLEIRTLEPARGHLIPALQAVPGDRIRISSDDPTRVTALLDAIAGIGGSHGGAVRIAGLTMEHADGRDRRRVLGMARGADPLPRGSVDRAVRYRLPDSQPEDCAPLIAALGLDEVLDGFPKREKTLLTRGGEPLTPSQRGLVHVARAAFGTPEVLVLDGILDSLDGAARRRVDAVVSDYPGVVISTDSGFSGSWRRWKI